MNQQLQASLLFFWFALSMVLAYLWFGKPYRHSPQAGVANCAISFGPNLSKIVTSPAQPWYIFSSADDAWPEIDAGLSKFPGTEHSACQISVNHIPSESMEALDWRIGWNGNNSVENLLGKYLRFRIEMVADQPIEIPKLTWYLNFGDIEKSLSLDTAEFRHLSTKKIEFVQDVYVPDDALDFEIWLRLMIGEHVPEPRTGNIWFAVEVEEVP